MRVLVVTARFPWPPFTGDRMRAIAWLDALAPLAEVTLVTPAGVLPPSHESVRCFVAPRAMGALLRGAFRVMTEALPATALLTVGWNWRAALRRAHDESGPFDATIVMLTRLFPWVTGTLHGGVTIVDAIDALSEGARERARAARGLARLSWQWEARRLARLEATCARRCDRVVVVAQAELPSFRGAADVLPLGIEVAPLAEVLRDYDVGFWGRLGFFANVDAADWLFREIWPRIRARRPEARLVVAGADAPARLRRWSGRDGVTVVSPVGDRPGLTRRVKIALVPLRYGTGMSTKALEAAESGCALVATAAGVRGVEPLARETIIAENAQGLADAVCRLLDDSAARKAQAARLRAVVEKEYRREDALRRMADLVRERVTATHPAAEGNGKL